MGPEFSFDEISLDQHASREQLEIDLYDELVTITDAEPDEQIRLLAVKPPAPVGPAEPDRPESIRITGSLAKDQSPANPPVTPLAVAGPYGKPDPAGGAYPAPEATAPEVRKPSPPLNGRNSGAIQPSNPGPTTPEIAPPLPQVQAPAPAPRKTQLAAPVPPPSKPVRTGPAQASVQKCPDCGQPAGELDMICIECGTFIG
jgi:hypothetical protein